LPLISFIPQNHEDTAMPKHLSPSPLCRIAELSDLMIDGCVCDERNTLIFASVWGRDTAIQEFVARLTLRSDEKGIDHFHLITEDDRELPVFIGNVDMLEKRTTRTFTGTLFGSMVHLWIFDKRCVKPDKSNATALAILTTNATTRARRLWKLVQETCPLPLLEHWCDTVMDLLRSRAMLSRLPFTIGPVEGYRLAIDVNALTTALGDLIRDGALDVTPCEVVPTEPLRLRQVA